ncbi:738_t:CDS:1, partial [Gigaspora rosea]
TITRTIITMSQETNKTEKTQKLGEVPTNFTQLFRQFLVNQDHINQRLAGIAEKQTASNAARTSQTLLIE